MIKATAHTHTDFCDGANTAEEMVLKAIDLGFKAIGFSSHSFCDYYTVGISKGNFNNYTSEIERLKIEYKEKISIYTGIELDILSEKPEFDFDYIIGSVHYIKGLDGKHYCIDSTQQKLQTALDEGFLGNQALLFEAYFDEVDRMITLLKPDICAHYDLLRCCNGDNKVLDLSSEAYKKAAMQALKKHCNNVIFEINTGGVARGRQATPYPETWLLEELCALGGRVMINSDTHAADTINAYFDEAEALAKEAGFKSVWALAENGIEEIEL